MGTDDSAAIAYAAGLFEGEGNPYLDPRGIPRLQIAMCDEEPLRRMVAAVGGSVSGPYRQKNAKPGWRPYWRWTLAGWIGFERVVGLMRPWLSQRRLRIIDDIIAKKPLSTPETPECGRPPSHSSVWAHRKKGERPCRSCREWGNAQSRPNAKTRRLRR